MNHYRLTDEGRVQAVRTLVNTHNGISTQEVMFLLLNGFVGYENMSDTELVEKLGERGLPFPEGTTMARTAASRTFAVSWETEVEDACSPRQAAERARAQQHPSTSATVFVVTDALSGEATTVDLHEDMVVVVPQPHDLVHDLTT